MWPYNKNKYVKMSGTSSSTSSATQRSQNYDNQSSSIRVDDQRSDDEESAGSLIDFIVSSEDSADVGEYVDTEDEEVTTASTALASELVDSLPYEVTGGTVVDGTGRRRSTRNRRAPERYVDPDHYEKLMYDDVSMEELSEENFDLSEDIDSEGDYDYVCDEEEYEYDEEESMIIDEGEDS